MPTQQDLSVRVQFLNMRNWTEWKRNKGKFNKFIKYLFRQAADGGHPCQSLSKSFTIFPQYFWDDGPSRGRNNNTTLLQQLLKHYVTILISLPESAFRQRQWWWWWHDMAQFCKIWYFKIYPRKKNDYMKIYLSRYYLSLGGY